MTDYTSLVTALRTKQSRDNRKLLDDAADAIERLQRERDAALADITPICMKCKYGHIEHMFEFPCVDCLDHDRWEWRGVDG